MEFIIIAVLLYIAAQTTYLSIQANRKHTIGKANRPIFVDTSALIDGRLVAIARSGFMTAPMAIPRSVVGELQYLADSADSEKRSRARHGLDVVNELQNIPGVTVTIFPDSPRAEEGVDNRLLSLSKKHGGSLCTIDYNLNKVAVVEGITVLNVNDLAKTLRMAYLPGERMKLELTQKGNDGHQAVGHLEDGTMVVVEHASQYLGSFKEIEFIRSLQTAAGKMMFARLVGEPGQEQRQKSSQAAPKAIKTAKTRQKVENATVVNAQQPRPPRQPAGRKPNNQQQRRRPQTNEDRLVELANRQDS